MHDLICSLPVVAAIHALQHDMMVALATQHAAEKQLYISDADDGGDGVSNLYRLLEKTRTPSQIFARAK